MPYPLSPVVYGITPLLTWAGSKRLLAPKLTPWILENLDLTHGRYFEPFCGSAAVFLRLRAEGYQGPASLSDRLAPLIETYSALKTPGLPAEVRKQLELLEDAGASRDAYESVKRLVNLHLSGKRLTPASLASCFLYLNRRSFNGLWRTNLLGRMNVPWGGERTTPLPTLKELEAFSSSLEGVELRCHDFEPILEEARYGDVIFADPPYAGAFTSYAGEFTEEDQERLRNALLAAWERGASLIATNADHPFIRSLYGSHPFELSQLEVSYSIGGKSPSRRKRYELLITAGALS